MDPKRTPIRLASLDPERFARLEAILEKVIDLPPREAANALDRLCGGDGELRAQAEELLEADRANPASFLSSGGPELEADALASLDEDLAGTRAGPYRLVREIGRGGMGRVYLAERADGQFEQRVAIKVLKRGLDTDELLRRFLRERQILARLEHPNIARLLDGGATADGRPYIAMELIEGVPISDWCDARGASVEERLDLFLAVCAAVQYAHRHLVVHRDLKPNNVLVTADGQPKLLDFGIARVLAGDAGTDAPGAAAAGVAHPLTRPEFLPMTPAYAAPEQLRGEPATTVTDVYGLGMVLYELLVGRRPFELRGRTMEELRREVLERTPTAPSRAVSDGIASPRLRRTLRGDLDAIVLTALATDPARRYGSVDALVEDIRRYRSHEPILARPPGRMYRLRKLARRHAGALTAAAILLALLVAYAATTAVMLDRQRRERARAETAARRAERIQTFLKEMLASAGPARLGEGTQQLGSGNPDPRVRDVLDRGAERVEKELADDPPVLASVEHTIAETYFSLEIYERAEQHARAALAIRERLGEHHAIAETLGLLAQILQRQTRYPEALSLAHRATSLERAAHGAGSMEYALALQNEQAILAGAGRTQEAGAAVATALRIGRAKLPPDDPRLIEILSSAAVEQGRLGRFEAADSLYRDVLARVRRVYGEDHPRTAIAMANLATNLGELKRYPEAEALDRQVLALRTRLLGAEHPEIATSLSNLGFALRQEGKLAEADSMLRQALAMRMKLLGPESRETLATKSILANVLLREGKAKQAESMHREVLAVRRRVLGANHPLVATSLVSLSEALVAQGRVGEARPLLREAVALRERVLPSGHPDIAKARELLAKVEAEVERPAR